MAGTRCVHFVPTLDQGGAERILVDLTRLDQQHEHIIVTLLRGPHFFSGRTHVRVLSLGAPGRLAALLMFPLLMIRAAGLLRRIQPHNVVGWLYFGAIFASLGRLYGSRVIWSVHATNLDFRHGHRMTRWARRICRVLSHTRACDLVHYCSDEGRVTHDRFGFEGSKAVVLPNAVDTSIFGRLDPSPADTAPPPVRANPTETLWIGCVARFEAQKDHATLMQALAELKRRGRRVRCLLAGRGCDLANRQLTEMIAAHGLVGDVVPLGTISNVDELYRRIDVLVLSSSYGESMPLVLIEAIALGCPVVATDVGSCREVVGAFGRIVPPRHPTAITDAILDVFENHDRSATEVSARQWIADHFSIERYVERWQGLLGAVLDLGSGLQIEESEPSALPSG